MGARTGHPRLDEVLQSTSDVLFPADLGGRRVEIDSRSADGDTPLHVMVWRQDRGGAARLIDGGADVNCAGDMGETPLHVAVTLGDCELIRLLLDAGARADVRSELGETARQKAVRAGGAVADLFLD